jgi:hypothetical protein
LTLGALKLAFIPVFYWGVANNTGGGEPSVDLIGNKGYDQECR